MKKELFDKILYIINQNYLFVGNEKIKWENLVKEYLPQILSESKYFFLTDMFRKMKDYHTGFLPQKVSCYLPMPLLWNKNTLYWVNQSNLDNEFYPVKSIAGVDVDKRIELYRYEYDSSVLMSNLFLLEDLVHGRFSENGKTAFEIDGRVSMIKIVEASNSIIQEHNFQEFKNNKSRKVYSQIINGNILYLKISSFYFRPDFNENTLKMSQRTVAIIFDLRDNQGGFIQNAKKFLGLFLSKDLSLTNYIILDKYGTYKQKIAASENGISIEGKRIYILINENTMSSAEYIFVQGLMQVYNCILVGMPTRGVSGQCKMYEIENEGLLSVTTKKYIDEKGDYLDRIIPDIELEMNIDDMCNGIDTQLQYIIDMETGYE